MSQLFAALGALVIVIAVFGLVGIWWSMIVLGLFLLASSFALHTHAQEPAAASVTKLAEAKAA